MLLPDSAKMLEMLPSVKQGNRETFRGKGLTCKLLSRTACRLSQTRQACRNPFGTAFSTAGHLWWLPCKTPAVNEGCKSSGVLAWVCGSQWYEQTGHLNEEWAC